MSRKRKRGILSPPHQAETTVNPTPPEPPIEYPDDPTDARGWVEELERHQVWLCGYGLSEQQKAIIMAMIGSHLAACRAASSTP